MIQLSTESFFQARIDKIKRGGIELLTALLQLWKLKMYDVTENYQSHGIIIYDKDGQRSTEADVYAIYMNQHRLAYFCH